MSQIYLAVKTMAAIEEAIAADSGNLYRHYLQQVLPHIEDSYRQDDHPFRTHMGASGIGDKCARKIWYGFRWVTRPSFEGRMLRLFNRGHLEEGRIIAALLTIGAQVYQQDENGHQFRISAAAGHAGGSGDGIVIGIPDVGHDVPMLMECKTHNDKSFQSLKANGVKEAKYEHYVQSMVYARKMELPLVLYIAVNKNNDELYIELLQLDSECADQYLDRFEQLVPLLEAPEGISKNPGWYECKWCDHRPVCHFNKTPEKTCRSCAYSQPHTEGAYAGKWVCHYNQMAPVELDKYQQLSGCVNWLQMAGI